MRKIKFKVLDAETKEFICHEFILDGTWYHYNRNNPDMANQPTGVYWDPNKEFIRIQFIGHCDKNGVEIYESDLLKDGKGNIGVIFYSEELASFKVNWKMEDGSWETDNCIDYGEVIGNKFEHPELLESK